MENVALLVTTRLPILSASRCFGRDMLTYPPCMLQLSGLRIDSMMKPGSRDPAVGRAGSSPMISLGCSVNIRPSPEALRDESLTNSGLRRNQVDYCESP